MRIEGHWERQRLAGRHILELSHRNSDLPARAAWIKLVPARAVHRLPSSLPRRMMKSRIDRRTVITAVLTSIPEQEEQGRAVYRTDRPSCRASCYLSSSRSYPSLIDKSQSSLLMQIHVAVR